MINLINISRRYIIQLNVSYIPVVDREQYLKDMMDGLKQFDPDTIYTVIPVNGESHITMITDFVNSKGVLQHYVDTIQIQNYS